MTSDDIAFHQTFKPRWGPMDTLICAQSTVGMTEADGSWVQGMSIASEGRDVSFLVHEGNQDPPEMIQAQKVHTDIQMIDNVSRARLRNVNFRNMAELATGPDVQSDLERQIWQLAHILFTDDVEDDISLAVPKELQQKYIHRIKKDRLSRLWENIIREKHGKVIEHIESLEERAFA